LIPSSMKPSMARPKRSAKDMVGKLKGRDEKIEEAYADLEAQLEAKIAHLRYRVSDLISRGYTDLEIQISIDPKQY
jgi:membrane-bound ClpP family serine protease